MLRGLKDKSEAIRAYEMSITLVPGYGEPCLNLAGVLTEEDRYNDALRVARMGMRANPDDSRLPAEVFNLRRRVAQWKNWNVAVRGLEKVLEDQATVLKLQKLSIQPFQAETYPVSQKTVELVKNFFSNDIAKHAELYMNAANIPELPKSHLASSWQPNHKLRVGFMTSDFRKHPMAYLFINMFRMLNHDKLFVVCIMTFHNDQSPYRQQVERDCAKFYDMNNLQVGVT
jgi:predicted O-linked N-acetylglucosamine transferase (SPINDLY family)